ncbi:HTH domain-containing protein [uncultured Aquimarina sp.]|uniref:HTH domain-containing protein n=1 Tax=uncultured Aquimarina sp. TaxID=575652 RepID=UPI00262245D2|nr:HTH domain-containing protein [uncultured Aquimarina sp.]
MTYKEKKEKLNYLCEMIENDWNTSLNMIASKFNCSERTAKRLIAELREEGREIYYCRTRKKYCI